MMFRFVAPVSGRDEPVGCRPEHFGVAASHMGRRPPTARGSRAGTLEGMMARSQRFAQGTKVPVERTRMEIEKTVKRYGADAFATFEDPSCQMIAFRVANLNVRFTVPLPKRKEVANASRYALTPNQLDAAVDQETRRRWRALLLSIKAKLEMVESGLACFEEEFLAHVVTGSGQTVGEALVPQIAEIQKGRAIPLIAGPPAASDSPESITAERMGKPPA